MAKTERSLRQRIAIRDRSRKIVSTITVAMIAASVAITGGLVGFIQHQAAAAAAAKTTAKAAQSQAQNPNSSPSNSYGDDGGYNYPSTNTPTYTPPVYSAGS